MRGAKIPNILRNALDGSITLSYQQPRYSLIWMHGLADRPDSYLPFFTHYQSPLYLGCRIKLIPAPTRLLASTQIQTSAWYDPQVRNEEDMKCKIDINQVNNSNRYIHDHFNEQMAYWKEFSNQRIVPHHRVYMGGMGQGASMALHYSYTSELVPAGVISASGQLLKETDLKNNRKIPVLLMHGQKDLVIRQIQARRSYSQVLKDQFLVQYMTFGELQHGVTIGQLKKITQWLEESHQFIKKHYETQPQ